MTTFHNFALNREIISQKVILETRNSNDVRRHVCVIHSRIKNLKNIQCKKEKMYKIHNKKVSETDQTRY